MPTNAAVSSAPLHVRFTVPYAARQWIRRRPSLYFVYVRWFTKRRHGLVSDATAVTIEGFPRSGNSFAVRAFTQANPHVEIAHHTHTPAQVLASVKRGIPTLIVIRPPADAVRSLLVMRKDLTLENALAWYVEFHEVVIRHREKLVVSAFDEVTTHFDRSIERLNDRFGTQFATFRHDADNVQQVFDAMERAIPDSDAETRKITHLARPQAARDGLKRAVTIPDAHPGLDVARRCYNELVGAPD